MKYNQRENIKCNVLTFSSYNALAVPLPLPFAMPLAIPLATPLDMPLTIPSLALILAKTFYDNLMILAMVLIIT